MTYTIIGGIIKITDKNGSHGKLCRLNCSERTNAMRKLLVYMKDYKKESFLAPLFKLLEATF